MCKALSSYRIPPVPVVPTGKGRKVGEQKRNGRRTYEYRIARREVWLLGPFEVLRAGRKRTIVGVFGGLHPRSFSTSFYAWVHSRGPSTAGKPAKELTVSQFSRCLRSVVAVHPLRIFLVRNVAVVKTAIMEVASPLAFGPAAAGKKRSLACSPQLLANSTNHGTNRGDMEIGDDYLQPSMSPRFVP